uniref:Uncharacterized protein n=1 Tax=Anopheles atroparvus TaxID=41427 RepID=A0A182IY90_ANOAO
MEARNKMEREKIMGLSKIIRPIGASIVAMCPKNVGLHTNPALAMCKPTFEMRPPTVTPVPAMLVPRDSSYKPIVPLATTPTTGSAPPATGTVANSGTITASIITTNNNSSAVTNNNTGKGGTLHHSSSKLLGNSNSQHSIVKSASGQQLLGSNALVRSNGTAKEASEEKSFL